MELNDLKRNWNNSDTKQKSREELTKLASIKNNPKLKHIRTKLLFETLPLTALLGSFYFIFDGASKPLWLAILLSITIVLFIGNGVLGFLTLLNPIQDSNLKNSCSTFIKRLKQISFFSLATSILFGSSLLLFFTYTIEFTPTKYLLLAGMIITFSVSIFISFRVWKGRIDQVKEVIKQLSS